MVPDCQSKSPSPAPAVQAWTCAPRGLAHSGFHLLQMEPRRQIGALLNETQARSQPCWAKSKNKFLPDIKSNQEPLVRCPSPACLPSFSCAVSCAVTPTLASLAQLFPSPNHRSPSDWTTRCSGSSVSSTAALIPKTTVLHHTHTQHLQHGAECIMAVRPPVVEEGDSHSDPWPSTSAQPSPCPATTRVSTAVLTRLPLAG